MSKNRTNNLVNAVEIAGVSQTEYDARAVKLVSVHVRATEVCLCASAVAAASVSSACNSFTDPCHGFATGLVGQFTTSCADLPSGLSTCTNYYIINVSSSVYKVATSRANAIAGTNVSLADAGTGTHTFTATSSSCTPASNGTVTFHASVDGENFATANYGCVSISLDNSGVSTFETFADAGFNVLQADVDVLLGQWTVDVDVSGKE